MLRKGQQAVGLRTVKLSMPFGGGRVKEKMEERRCGGDIGEGKERSEGGVQKAGTPARSDGVFERFGEAFAFLWGFRSEAVWNVASCSRDVPVRMTCMGGLGAGLFGKGFADDDLSEFGDDFPSDTGDDVL